MFTLMTMNALPTCQQHRPLQTSIIRRLMQKVLTNVSHVPLPIANFRVRSSSSLFLSDSPTATLYVLLPSLKHSHTSDLPANCNATQQGKFDILEKALWAMNVQWIPDRRQLSFVVAIPMLLRPYWLALSLYFLFLSDKNGKRESDPVRGPVWPRGWVEV